MAYAVFMDGQQVGWQTFQYYTEADAFRKQVQRESGKNQEHFTIREVRP
ncbi:MAG: hypothetical protein ACLRFI_02675 [Alphaproteobacteria bacterium]